ncbi:MAG: hypothetical protein WDL87_03445 [Candidatus Omnitrophota bacterium]|jgi:hypothetical protein
MELLNPKKSPEQNLSDYIKFFKKHPAISIVVIVVILALSGWNIYLQYTGKRINECEQTISALNRELEAKRAEIQRLETQLVPFRTFALEHYPGSEAEALAKLAQKITDMELTIVALRDYGDIAKLGPMGSAIVGGRGIKFSTPLSRMMEGTCEITGDQAVFILTPEAETKSMAVIEKFPNFPFAYYHVALCFRARNDNKWRTYAQKAKEIFEITTTIGGHVKSHDEALENILIFLRQ